MVLRVSRPATTKYNGLPLGHRSMKLPVKADLSELYTLRRPVKTIATRLCTYASKIWPPHL
jgi:hypothetical protein